MALNELMKQGAELYVRGKDGKALSYRGVAREMGLHENTLYNWKKNNEWQEYVLYIRKKVEQELVDSSKTKLGSSVDKAISTLVGLLDSDNDSIRLQASREILDRTIGKATVKTEVEVNSNTTNNVEPNDIANKIADMFGSGAPIFIEEHKIEEVDIDSNSDKDIDSKDKDIDIEDKDK